MGRAQLPWAEQGAKGAEHAAHGLWSSLPSPCLSLVSRNPAGVGEETLSTAPTQGWMGLGTRRGWYQHAGRVQAYHVSAGGQGKQVLRAGMESDKMTWEMSVLGRDSPELWDWLLGQPRSSRGITSPALPPADCPTCVGMEELQQ